MADSDKQLVSLRDSAEEQAAALKLIAALFLIAAAWAAAELLVPFFLAMLLALAFTPVVRRLESLGLPRGAAALICTLTVAAALGLAAGLILYEAGTIVQDSDRYIKRFGGLIDRASTWAHSGRTAGHPEAKAEGPGASQTDARGPEADRKDQASPPPGPGRTARGAARRRCAGGWNHWRWLASGVGGLLGAVGEAVVFLAFLFYMIQGREAWVESLGAAARRLGMRPGSGQLEKVQGELVHYLGVLSLVASCYVVVVSLVLWAIGVPQPLLWGVLAGMLEVIPYFGPLVASVLPTIVALSLGSWWQPLAVALFFLSLHLMEGYVISPVLYGRAVRFDPVTILFGAIFFGGLWGPIGLAVATPMMIVLRGLLVITPDTPALDALADVKEEKARAGADQAAPTRHGP